MDILYWSFKPKMIASLTDSNAECEVYLANAIVPSFLQNRGLFQFTLFFIETFVTIAL